MLTPLRAAGEVLPAARSVRSGSYLSALDLALERLDDDDLVYLGKDDYLHADHAFAALLDAAGALSQASYFGLYASIIWPRSPGFWVGDVLWHTAASTTLSFAARVGAPRADRRLHALALRVGMVVDTEICLADQGPTPYPWRQLVGEGPRGRALGGAWVNGIAWRRGFAPGCVETATGRAEQTALREGRRLRRMNRDPTLWARWPPDADRASDFSAEQ